jgi:hypothetical protein
LVDSTLWSRRHDRHSWKPSAANALNRLPARSTSSRTPVCGCGGWVSAIGLIATLPEAYANACSARVASLIGRDGGGPPRAMRRVLSRATSGMGPWVDAVR